jgi:HK97 family phage portal protein
MPFLQNINPFYSKNSSPQPTISPSRPSDITKILDYLSISGSVANPTTAETITTVYYCVDKIASLIASMPRHIYRRSDLGRTLVADHDQSYLISKRPNPYQTKTLFDRTSIYFLLLWGNAIIYMTRDPRTGRPISHTHWHPKDVTIFKYNGDLYYHNHWLTITAHHLDIRHYADNIRDPYTYMAKSRIAIAAEKITETLDYNKFSSAFVKNGTHFGLFVSYAANNDPKKNKEVREKLEEDAGPTRAGKNIVAGGGASIQTIGMPLRDSQFLETRQMNKEEIGLLFGVKPGMLGGAQGESYNTLAEYNEEFIQYPLAPIAKNIEEEDDYKIFRESERLTHYTKYNFNALMRGNANNRAELYKAMGPSLTPNDILALEDMNGFEGGDVRLVPLNMTTLQNIQNPTSDESTAD